MKGMGNGRSMAQGRLLYIEADESQVTGEAKRSHSSQLDI
jgi:hypothetical protein